MLHEDVNSYSTLSKQRFVYPDFVLLANSGNLCMCRRTICICMGPSLALTHPQEVGFCIARIEPHCCVNDISSTSAASCINPVFKIYPPLSQTHKFLIILLRNSYRWAIFIQKRFLFCILFTLAYIDEECCFGRKMKLREK